MDRKVSSISAGDEGFATATAIMLCVGLAVVSVALVDLGFASARRGQQEVERETERQALRSAIAEAAADLVNRPEAGLGLSTRQYGDLKVEIVAANELTKADAYHATETQLATTFEALSEVDAPETAAKVIAARAAAGADDLPLEDFLKRLDVAAEIRFCLQEQLTVHASSVDPFALAGGGAPTAKDGGIVNLRARIVGGRPLDLTRESIVVITGDRQAPLLVVSERTFRTSQIERCSDETT